MATRLRPESTQRRAIIAAAISPLCLSLQLFLALLFPLAAANRAWAQDAGILLICEIILVQVGFLSAGFANLRAASGAMQLLHAAAMLIVAAFFSFLFYIFSGLAHNWWVVVNVGIILVTRLASAPFDGTQGAAERFARGLAMVAVFGVLMAAPLLSVKRFPSFGFTREVYAELAPTLGEVTGRMFRDGGDLARAVLLCALLYLLSAVVELLRLRTVFREESAPALGIADDNLAVRPDGNELTVARTGNYAGGLLAIAIGVGFFAPFVLERDWKVKIFGLLFAAVGILIIRWGLKQLFSRTVFRVRRGEIVIEERPALGSPVKRSCTGNIAGALAAKPIAEKKEDPNTRVSVSVNSKPVAYGVFLTLAGQEVVVTDELDTLSEAEGLRKLMLSYAQGIEQPAVRKSLHEDADVYRLFGKETVYLFSRPVSAPVME